MRGTKQSARALGARLLGLGLASWAFSVGLVLLTGYYSVLVVTLGGAGLAFGAVRVVWGDAVERMTWGQKVPAVGIALLLVGFAVVGLLRWLSAVVPTV